MLSILFDWRKLKEPMFTLDHLKSNTFRHQNSQGQQDDCTSVSIQTWWPEFNPQCWKKRNQLLKVVLWPPHTFSLDDTTKVHQGEGEWNIHTSCPGMSLEHQWGNRPGLHLLLFHHLQSWICRPDEWRPHLFHAWEWVLDFIIDQKEEQASTQLPFHFELALQEQKKDGKASQLSLQLPK